MQATSFVTWHQPMDGSIYPPPVVGNPCTYLLENALCYIISGLMLLVVGVIITSLTFQNLEDYKEEHINRYAGPVLIGAGILVIARGALSHLCPQRSQFARQRSLLRRYVRELYTRPIFGTRHTTDRLSWTSWNPSGPTSDPLVCQLRNDSTDLCDIHVSESQDISGLQECPRPTRPNPPTFLSQLNQTSFLSAPYSPGPPSYSSTPYSPLPPVYSSAPGSPHNLPRPSFFQSRLRMYSDDPPPYDVVISEEYIVTNPVPDIMHQAEANETTNTEEDVFQNATEGCMEVPPPSYEEFMRTSTL